MKAKLTLLLLPTVAGICIAQENSAPKNELSFGLGGIPSLSRSDSPTVEAGSGVAFQVNYGRRFLKANKVALYGEINFVASPLRDVSSSVTTATHDFASLYLTPGIRVKFMPASRVSPFAVAGGGYSDYEQSTMQIDGRPNSVSRELARGALDFGVGVDVRVWRFVALRGEARDFYTGAPGYNIATSSGGQHNVVATGAFVLRWH
jgi:outer membrane protein with beta-barrel domain